MAQQQQLLALGASSTAATAGNAPNWWVQSLHWPLQPALTSPTFGMLCLTDTLDLPGVTIWPQRFAQLVVNAPAGTVSINCRMRGNGLGSYLSAICNYPNELIPMNWLRLLLSRSSGHQSDWG